MESQVRGGTRWKRFALVMVPSVAATAAIGVGLAQGALAASFSVSGVDFKVTAEKLDGQNLLQYGSVATGKSLQGQDMHNPVVVSGFSHADISKMCQSVVQPLPMGLGYVTMKLKAGGGQEKIAADNIYLDVSELSTDAKFTHIDIGVAAGEGKRDKDGNLVTSVQPGADGKVAPGSQYGFAQRADRAELSNVEQRAWATTAGSFKLPGLKLSLAVDKDAKKNECGSWQDEFKQ
ncbi:hypothetical protein DWB77_02502 [Streptomyces hundungensis]|uniref:Cholesterol esterase n=1 Tax=Streptomyces hundungensis TaxID=1077946 RepID=A0A387HCJ3_9ACTN|nr:DUF6230 family protein [Streptomyces hundungensis]AYG80371.1 hypothetical protein DWB77_02502 [Streptomyces hundungensis]